MVFGILSFISDMAFVLAPLGVIFGPLGLRRDRIATECEIDNGKRATRVILSKVGAIFSSIAIFIVIFTIVMSIIWEQ